MASAKEKKLIRDLHKKILAKKEIIEKAEKGSYVTNGMFSFGRNSESTNIKTQRSPERLRDMLSFLYQKIAANTKASEFLGLEDNPTWEGATIAQWENDLKLRVDQLNLKVLKEKAAEDIAALLRMDPSLEREIKLDEIGASLKD